MSERKRLSILGVGEVLWDLLPAGKQLGGAPANFVYHCRAMGADASLVSRVGDDALGREIVERLFSLAVPTCSVSLDASHQTGVVDVELQADGQPRYIIREDVAWDHLQPEAVDSAAEADAICFGTLAQRGSVSRATIRELVDATPANALRVFDVNLRQNFYSKDIVVSSLERANALKLNDAELPIVAGLLGIPAAAPRQQLEELACRHALRLIAYTRGAEGSDLWLDGKWSSRPALAVEVKDTIGAGDAFTAAIVVGALRGWDLDAIHEAANEVAAFVCTQSGGTPAWPAALTQRFGPAAS